MNKLLIIVFFNFVYVIPLVSLYIQKGVEFSGNKFFHKTPKISTFEELFIHLISHLSDYMNIFQNPIFLFFISALVFQKICKWIKTL